MLEFERMTDEIFRLKVPFENIYTAVFLIKTESGDILVDAAAGKADAENVIIPALEKCTSLDRIKYLVCTHLHGDHGGGIRFLLPSLQNAKVAAASKRACELYGEENVKLIVDGDSLCGIKVLSLKGHSLDCVGLLEEKSGTLIAGDAVQLCGITKYGCGVGHPAEYRKTLERISKMKLNMLVASHEYYPLGAVATGGEIINYLDTASTVYKRITAFVKENAAIGDAVAIAKLFTEKARESEPDMPTLQSYTVKALLEEN